ncbi:hypothetical protein CU7111_1580 [Corynebacterium urealyticum DSM 7111]|nr:hypothetical protein CU7111_1580 [Corynebacterium urealyticum DSM 7111]QQB07035.1 hypothetical protein I6H53_06805 [Corynebacterium urealyticum]
MLISVDTCFSLSRINYMDFPCKCASWHTLRINILRNQLQDFLVAYQKFFDRQCERRTRGGPRFAALAAPMVAPQAAPALLLGKYPSLSHEQRAEILRQTAGPAGYPLDKQGPEGSWQRRNLPKALTAKVTIADNVSVEVAG